MAIGTVDITTLESALTASADAIREKSESAELIDFDMEGGTGFAEAIGDIPTGFTPSGTKSITANGVYDVRQFASADVAIPTYDGDYSVSPDFIGRTLFTKNKLMIDDVTVEPIEVHRTSNPQGGKTVYIGGILNG